MLFTHNSSERMRKVAAYTFPKFPFKRFIQNLALFITSLCIVLLASEFLVRLFFPAPARASVTIHRLSKNPILLYEPAPNAKVYSADGILHQANSDGFRDREYTLIKTPGTKRIIFLGDSIVYGYGVERKDAIPEQLERAYNQAGKKVEVLNFGVAGYDTEQEVEFLKTKGLKYKPDTVVLGYTLNDVRYASWELETFWAGFTATAHEPLRSPLKQSLAWLFCNSRLLKLLNKQFHIQKKVKFLQGYPLLNEYVEKKAKLNRDEAGSEYSNLEKKIEDKAKELGTSPGALDFEMKEIGFRNQVDIYKSQWKACAKALEKLKALSVQNNFKVVVVIFPLFTEMDKYPLEPLHEFLKTHFSSLGFQTLDTLEVSKKLFMDKVKMTPDGVHLTPTAAEKIASSLEADILN